MCITSGDARCDSGRADSSGTLQFQDGLDSFDRSLVCPCAYLCVRVQVDDGDDAVDVVSVHVDQQHLDDSHDDSHHRGHSAATEIC